MFALASSGMFVVKIFSANNEQGGMKRGEKWFYYI